MCACVLPFRPPSQPKLARLGATHLTQVLLAVSALRYVPPQAWLVAFLRVGE